jgi:uncharacterized membrane protein YfbV (UPF0208 family)
MTVTKAHLKWIWACVVSAVALIGVAFLCFFGKRALALKLMTIMAEWRQSERVEALEETLKRNDKAIAALEAKDTKIADKLQNAQEKLKKTIRLADIAEGAAEFSKRGT